MRVLGWNHRNSAATAALVAVVGLAACSGGTPDPVAVRVGDVTIAKPTIEHWASAISRGAIVPEWSKQPHRTRRQQALGFLITSNWLLGEAADHGLAQSDEAVAERLDEQRESVPGGATEFQNALDETGKTISDVKLEIRAELATAMLRRMLVRSVEPITRSQAADYYRANVDDYRSPERRIVDLIETLKSEAAAKSLEKRVGSGAKFEKLAFHESLERPPISMPVVEKAPSSEPSSRPSQVWWAVQ